MPASHEFDEQAHIPQLEEVTTAYAEVLAHNGQHTGFRAAFRGVVTALIAEEEEPGDIDAQRDKIAATLENAQQDVVTEGDMDAELQSMFHGELFTHVGIKIAPLGSVLRKGEGERATSTELVPMVENTELYVGFLSQLDREAVQADDNNVRLMVDVVNTLKQTVTTCFSELPAQLSEAEKRAFREHGEDALRTFLAVDDEYKRLGLDKPDRYQAYAEVESPTQSKEVWDRYKRANVYAHNYAALEHYVTYWGRDVLPEYIAVGSMEALEGSKVPYFDDSHDELGAKVAQIVSLVGPGRTTQYGIEAAQAMCRGIERTLQEMDDDPTAWFTQDSNRKLLEDSAVRLRSVTG